MNNVSEHLTSGLVNGTFTIAVGDEELNADPSTVYSQYSEGCPDGMIASVSICGKWRGFYADFSFEIFKGCKHACD